MSTVQLLCIAPNYCAKPGGNETFCRDCLAKPSLRAFPLSDVDVSAGLETRVARPVRRSEALLILILLQELQLLVCPVKAEASSSHVACLQQSASFAGIPVQRAQ